VATILQDPKVKNLADYFSQQKGSKLTKQEQVILADRVAYAKIWLKDYAPQKEVLAITAELPQEALQLSQEQKEYLQAVSSLLAEKDWNPGDLQQALYEKSKELGVPAKKAFGAIYLSLLGKTYGPKAAWVLIDNIEEAKKRFSTIGKEEQ